MKDQSFLRQQVKMAKALNDDWSYKDISEVIGVTEHAFYNWLCGYYNLSSSKEEELKYLIADLLQ